jgi:hypothetical protein
MKGPILTHFDFKDLEMVHPLVRSGYTLLTRRPLDCQTVLNEVHEMAQL